MIGARQRIRAALVLLCLAGGCITRSRHAPSVTSSPDPGSRLKSPATSPSDLDKPASRIARTEPEENPFRRNTPNASASRSRSDDSPDRVASTEKPRTDSRDAADSEDIFRPKRRATADTRPSEREPRNASETSDTDLVACIDRELPDLTDKERAELLEQLRGVGPAMVRPLVMLHRLAREKQNADMAQSQRSGEKGSQSYADDRTTLPRSSAPDVEKGRSPPLPGSTASVPDVRRTAGPIELAAAEGMAPAAPATIQSPPGGRRDAANSVQVPTLPGWGGHAPSYAEIARDVQASGTAAGLPWTIPQSDPPGMPRPNVAAGGAEHAHYQTTPNESARQPTAEATGTFPGQAVRSDPGAQRVVQPVSAVTVGSAVSTAAAQGDRSPLSAQSQMELQRLIASAEAEAAATGIPPAGNDLERRRYIEKQVSLRMLYWMAGQQERALQAIPGIDAADQEFWQQTFWAFANYFDARNIPDRGDRAAQTAAQLRTAVDRLQETARLELRNTSFCHKISSFGSYERFSRDEFTRGQPVLVYAEVHNFKSAPRDDGQYVTRLRSTIEIYNAAGGLIERIPFPETEDLCRNHRRDYYHSYEFTIPAAEKIAIGPHSAKLIVEDLSSHKIAESSINFTVK